MIYLLWALFAFIVCYIIVKFFIYVRNKWPKGRNQTDMDWIMARRGNRSRIRYPYKQRQSDIIDWSCNDGDSDGE